jgi:serine/threonine protein kinase
LIQLSYKPCNDNVVCYYDVFRDNNIIYIVMQYVQGQNLLETVQSVKRYVKLFPNFVYDFMLFLLKDILQGLAYVHSKGIVHGDIKPDNIIVKTSYKLMDKNNNTNLAGSYRPMLLDFGLACSMNNQSCDGASGTPTYVAPEILTLQRRNFESDIWSLGITIIKSLGVNPWAGFISVKGNNNTKQFLRYLMAAPPIPQLHSPNIFLNRMVNSMLVKNPAKRKTANELLTMLGDIYESQTAKNDVPNNFLFELNENDLSQSL